MTMQERMTLDELRPRWARIRKALGWLETTDKAETPETAHASGLLIFSRLNIYYVTGTLGVGVAWLPREGEPALLLRKGLERAQLESPLGAILPFRSYADIPQLLAEAGSPLGTEVAAEMTGLSWAMADMLRGRIPGVRFTPGDAALKYARSVKTPWELVKLREAGRRHRLALEDLLPALIRPGMTENEMARLCIQIYLEHGHGGLLRMTAPGEEVFFGHIAAADSGNHPHYYNGPMGFRGIHPALPCLGSATVWTPGSPLTVDMAFTLDGYATDKTQMYFAGSPRDLPDNARIAWEVCAEVQQRAAAALKPGAIPSRIWRDTLAFVETTPFAPGALGGFMGLGANAVPFLGHGIGLAIDEQPVIAKGFDEPLETGMTIALEPKMGIAGFGMVGLENTFEITDEGAKNLTGAKPEILFLS